jgi:hypothetical protein
MVFSFPMDEATEKGSNFSHHTSGRAQHEGLFDFGEDSRENSGEKGFLWRDLSRILSGREDSWDNSRENASISKCHCSVNSSSKQRYCLSLKDSCSPLRIETADKQ